MSEVCEDCVMTVDFNDNSSVCDSKRQRVECIGLRNKVLVAGGLQGWLL